MNYHVAGTDGRGAIVKMLAENVSGYYAAKCSMYHALRSTDLTRFALIDSATGQVTSRFSHDYNDKTKRFELKRTSRRREGANVLAILAADAMDAATPEPTAEENRATILQLLERIADLTPIAEDRKECVQEFAKELDRMVRGFLPYDAGSMMDTLDRIRTAATEAQDALQEIETAKIALADMEWGPEDMAAIDPNNHPTVAPNLADDFKRSGVTPYDPPREFPAMGEEDWAAEAVWAAGLGT